MSRVLVTGGTGRIGRALVARLRALGAEVVTYDVRAKEPALERIDRCDAVVHLAAPPSIPREMDPQAAVAATCGLTAEVVRSLHARAGRFVFSSTALVYGESNDGQVTEETAPAPATLYAALKLACEAVFSQTAAADVLRLSVVYSDESSEETVLGTIVHQAARGPRIEVRDATPVRDFIHLDDAVSAIVSALAAPPPRGLRVSNVGGAEGLSIGDVARRALAVAGQDRDAIVSSTRAPSGGRLVLDSRFFQQWSGYRPSVSLDDGLRRALAAVRQRIHE